jgi:7-cyano-7-deazaguanine synthase
MREAVVLLSGGLDSATTLAVARAEGFRVHALTVAYGQRHELEVARAGEIAAILGAASHRVLRLDLRFLRGSALTDADVAVPKGRSDDEIGSGIPSTYVPARNTVFLALALAWAETLGAGDLFLGVNALDYSGYPDCRPEYLEAFETMANLATRAGVEGSRLRIRAPLLRCTKAEIVRRAAELGVPLDRTVSCYDPDAGGRPCRACDACRLRAKGFAEAGFPDPALEGEAR